MIKLKTMKFQKSNTENKQNSGREMLTFCFSKFPVFIISVQCFVDTEHWYVKVILITIAVTSDFSGGWPVSRLANLVIFDSKGLAFWPPFCMFSKICNPTVRCATVRKLLFQVNFATWSIKRIFSQFSRLVLFDFLRFVMAITPGGGHSYMKVTYLCLPAFKSRGL